MKNQDIRDKAVIIGTKIINASLFSIGDNYLCYKLKNHINEINALLIDIEKSHKDAGLFGEIEFSASESLEIHGYEDE